MIELNIRYTLESPKGTISRNGIAQIIRFVQAQRVSENEWKRLNPESTIVYLPTLPEDWRWVWVVTGKGEYVGTLPKRVRKYYYQEHGLKCPDEFIQEIGNVARQHAEDNHRYTFEFVTRFDWTPGEHGDSGSCYWTTNSGAREMLSDNGGLAVLFFDSQGDGLARAWVVKIEDMLYVIFNGYGFPSNSTLTIARVVSLHMNLSYKKIKLMNNHRDTGVLWINGGIGYVVGKPETLANLSEHDFRWDELNACYSCGERVNEDYAYISPDGETYCQDCFYETFDYCYHCNEVYWNDDIYYVEAVGSVCENCLDRHYTRCESCAEYVRNEDIVKIEGKYYCEGCAPED